MLKMQRLKHAMQNATAVNAAALVALKAFWKISARWLLNDADQLKLLGLSEVSTIESWRTSAAVDLPFEVITRLSLVLGIYKAINTLLPVPERADAWMRKPNMAPFLDGQSALDRMLSGSIDDLYAVCRYLDGEITH
jgi:hypothetical protein